MARIAKDLAQALNDDRLIDQQDLGQYNRNLQYSLFKHARLGTYSGAVTFFRAIDKLHHPANVDSIYGWRMVAPRLKLIDVPGSHFGESELD